MGDLAKAELYVAGAYLVDYSGFFDKHFNSSIIPMRAYQGMNVADAWHDRNLNFDYYNTDIPYGYPGHHGLSTANRAFGAISSPPAESLIMKTWELGEHIVATGSDYYYYPYQDLLNEPYFRYTVKLHDNLIDKDVYLGVVEETRIGRGFDVWKRQAFGIRDNISEANVIDFENNDRVMAWKRCFNFDDYTLARTTCIYRLNINAALYAFEFEGATNPSSQGYCQIVTIPTSMLNFTFKYKNFNNEWVGTDSNIGSYDYFPLYGAASRYTLPDLMYEKPQPKKKGEYKGMPSSNIPLRQTIRTGVDYRHTLDLYDETNYSPKNMFLTNRVGTIDYAQIEFGYDTGRIRCRTELQFTHFVTSSFSDDNRPLVYRVTHYTVLGTDLIEYNYEIDYIKTWFQYHGFTTYNPICTRSTNSTGYEPFKQDTCLLTGKVINNNYNLRSPVDYGYVISAVNVYGNITHYYLTKAGLTAFRVALNNEVLQKQIVNQIIRITQVPTLIASSAYRNNFTLTDKDNIVFSTLSSEGSEPVPVEIAVSCKEINISGTVTNATAPDHYIEIDLSGQFKTINDFSDLNGIFNMFVPYYGYFSMDEHEVLMISQSSDRRMRYYLDLMGGNVAIQLFGDNGQRGKLHQFVSSPTETIVARDLEAIRYTNQAQEVAQSQSVRHGVTSVVMGATTGAIGGFTAGTAIGGIGALPGAVIGGAAGAAKAAVGAVNSYTDLQQNNAAQMEHLLGSLTQDNVIAAGTVATSSKCIFIVEFIPEKSTPQAEYYSVIGYPIDKPLLDVGMVAGNCYWLTWNFSVIPELSEIISGFAMASADGIVYNI